jgi:hypothetical protein
MNELEIAKAYLIAQGIGQTDVGIVLVLIFRKCLGFYNPE